MPLVATRGAASAQGFGEFGQTVIPNYIEDVFSTYLYTGNGSTQTITNGINLSGSGGLVWVKSRSAATNHALTDSTMNLASFPALSSNTTNALGGNGDINAFTTSGFSLGFYSGAGNASGTTYASWTFRKAPKFFTCLTYTGNGVAGRQIAHDLGSVPGCIIVKHTSGTSTWRVYHRSLGAASSLILSSTTAATASSWNSTEPTSTVFSVSDSLAVNAAGETYVAYVLAHNAGGFGAAGTDNVISCGSYVGNGLSAGPTITLGYEPQWLMIKQASASGTGWVMYDTMRGLPVGTDEGPVLFADTSAGEAFAGNSSISVTPTGFILNATSSANLNASGSTYIYVAIRRGPMKTPTSGASVFAPASATSGPPLWQSGFPVDLGIYRNNKTTTSNTLLSSRLLGAVRLETNTSNAEAANASQKFDYMNGFFDSSSVSPPENFPAWMFRRAPSFMDVVCYTGTGANRNVAHGLNAVPELMLVKYRNVAASWQVYSASLANTEYLVLNSTAAKAAGTTRWNSTTPTSTVFTLGTVATVNASGGAYIAYLFASCPGVSKVGSYTGNGSSQTLDCGFAAGARFVMVKRTDSTGNWLVVDTARGLVAAGDPTLYLNATDTEVAGADWLDPDASGFIVNQEATMNANVNGGQYIFLAIS